MITSSFEVIQARVVFNAGNPDAKRLYDDLLSNYNKLVRPVVNTTDRLKVRIKLKLSQLIDVVSSKSPHLHSIPNPKSKHFSRLKFTLNTVHHMLNF